jgi:hypothetical protein
METTEAKKALYKEKPFANRVGIIEHNKTKKRTHLYFTELFNFTKIAFEVPEEEMGRNIFEPNIQAQLLIRWMKVIN